MKNTKKIYLSVLVLSIGLLSGCWGKKKPEQVTQKDGLRNANQNKVAGFFTDQDAMKQAEQLVLSGEETFEQDSFRIADAGKKVEGQLCRVQFEYDSAAPCKDQKKAVAQVKKQVKEWKDQGYEVAFCGHSCKYHGTDTYNIALSQQRAESLAKTCAVDTKSTKIFGVGNEQPIVDAPANNKLAQAPNRCVEVYPLAAATA